jgi:hypothetical protein
MLMCIVQKYFKEALNKSPLPEGTGIYAPLDKPDVGWVRLHGCRS